jgi:hypothetical protein
LKRSLEESPQMNEMKRILDRQSWILIYLWYTILIFNTDSMSQPCSFEQWYLEINSNCILKGSERNKIKTVISRLQFNSLRIDSSFILNILLLFRSSLSFSIILNSNVTICTRGEFMALACQCHSVCFYCNPVLMILRVSSIYWTWNDVDRLHKTWSYNAQLSPNLCWYSTYSMDIFVMHSSTNIFEPMGN